MAIHINSYALMARGYKLIAVYDLFDKGQWSEERQKYFWDHSTVKCFKNDDLNKLVVRYVSGRGSIWDDVYTERDDANWKVQHYLDGCTFYKRRL